MPNQMTPGQARVIDPIISTAVRGYKNSALIGTEALFPVVEVAKSGGTRIEFGKEDFREVNTRRAPGARVAEVQFGHSGLPFSLVHHALAGKVPQELVREAAGTPAADQLGRAAQSVMNLMLLQLEREQAALATTAANYASGNKVTLASNDQWSAGTHADSDPLQDVITGKAAIRAKIGQEPNTMVMGYSVFQQLKKHNKLIESIKYSKSGNVRMEDIKAYFEMDRIFVGGAVTANAANVFSDVWGKHVVLAYVNPTPSSMGEPSYGYTYQLSGSPNASETWFVRENKSWMTDVEFDRSAEIVGAEGGYLITNAVA